MGIETPPRHKDIVTSDVSAPSIRVSSPLLKGQWTWILHHLSHPFIQRCYPPPHLFQAHLQERSSEGTAHSFLGDHHRKLSVPQRPTTLREYQSKELRNSTRTSRERGGFRQGGSTQSSARDGGAPMRRRRIKFDSSKSVPYSRPPGDINTRCQHDLYDGPALNNTRSGGVSMTGGPTKLVVTNLDYGVIFSKVGPIHSATVNYEKSGRSMGSAYVVFKRKADAVRAMKLYNRVPLDGRPMHIELTTSDVCGCDASSRPSQRRLHPAGLVLEVLATELLEEVSEEIVEAREEVTDEQLKNKVPTAAELDAELDAYISPKK
ncbi:aly/REF export factor 2-like, partial [Homalodisca vitripennis]|uniref:aly/REF export factor 2-like n=1 Tax=Homalodisca vitripennis TaxID=197043 RepID=UPI001EEBA418